MKEKQDPQIEQLLNQHVKGLNPKQAVSKGDNAIRLDKGELPYAPSESVVKAIAAAASEINRYPEVLGGSLRKALAAYTGKKEQEIVIGNGSDDLIELILKVFLQPGEEVILPVPTFFVYNFATKVVGGVPVWVSRTADFGLDLEALTAKITSKTKVIFLANPNNPTANLVKKETIIKLLEIVNCIIVVDECYYEFCQATVADLIEQYPNLIVLRSLSKSFGLAGIRLGYAIANETIIDYLYRAAQLFPVNKLAIVAGNAALEAREYGRENIRKVMGAKTRLAGEIEKLGFLVYPSATNFLFVSTEPLGISSKDLVQYLKDNNILVADFGWKQGLDGYYWRTAVGTAKENEILIDCLNRRLPRS